MGDCDLKEIKKLYGDKIVLKGNLHTTNIMLNGSVDDVIKSCKKLLMMLLKVESLFSQQGISVEGIHLMRIYLPWLRLQKPMEILK